MHHATSKPALPYPDSNATILTPSLNSPLYFAHMKNRLINTYAASYECQSNANLSERRSDAKRNC